jgi:uncharacterized protein
MELRVTFQFFGNLNDFLPANRRDQPIDFPFTGKTPLKDPMEAIGVPHTEAGHIQVNQQASDLSYCLRAGDFIRVHPFAAPLTGKAAFVLDVHLGKLARLLRMLGFDTLYTTFYEDPEIVSIAAAENRIVLTRDIPLLKHKILAPGQGYWLRSQHPDVQLAEVMHRFGLSAQIQPLQRCIRCNGRIEAVSKASVIEQLEPQTRAHFQEFFRCASCEKVYWKGSHYERMQQMIQQITGK